MAINWSRAYPEFAQTAIVKQELTDFRVVEELSFTPAGEGEHLYLRLRKSALTTPQVAKLLQQAFAVPRLDVSYAGLKDRHGICEQWFSIRAPQQLPAIVELDQVQELERTWHASKLRRGQILKNTFEIRLREVALDENLQERLSLLSAQGVPNYFGEQRFGHNGENIAAARDWLCQRRSRRIDPFMKGIYLSTLRSLLFNSVLQARVKTANWNRIISGDVVIDEFATAPLWGRGRSGTSLAAGDIELAALLEFAEICADLEFAGVNQGRRALVLQPQDLTWKLYGRNETSLQLKFALVSGSYATVLLRECLQITDSSVERAA